jgi:hypothetical protein
MQNISPMHSIKFSSTLIEKQCELFVCVVHIGTNNGQTMVITKDTHN